MLALPQAPADASASAPVAKAPSTKSRVCYVKRLTLSDACTSKQIKLPRAAAETFLRTMQDRESISLNLQDEENRVWNFTCTRYNVQYALSKIGPFAIAHNVQPDDHLIFYTDDKGTLRVTIRKDVPCVLKNGLSVEDVTFIARQSGSSHGEAGHPLPRLSAPRANVQPKPQRPSSGRSNNSYSAASTPINHDMSLFDFHPGQMQNMFAFPFEQARQKENQPQFVMRPPQTLNPFSSSQPQTKEPTGQSLDDSLILKPHQGNAPFSYLCGGGGSKSISASPQLFQPPAFFSHPHPSMMPHQSHQQAMTPFSAASAALLFEGWPTEGGPPSGPASAFLTNALISPFGLARGLTPLHDDIPPLSEPIVETDAVKNEVNPAKEMPVPPKPSMPIAGTRSEEDGREVAEALEMLSGGRPPARSRISGGDVKEQDHSFLPHAPSITTVVEYPTDKKRPADAMDNKKEPENKMARKDPSNEGPASQPHVTTATTPGRNGSSFVFQPSTALRPLFAEGSTTVEQSVGRAFLRGSQRFSEIGEEPGSILRAAMALLQSPPLLPSSATHQDQGHGRHWMFGLPTPGARHMPFAPPPPAPVPVPVPVSGPSSSSVLQQLEQLSDSIIACKILSAADLTPQDPCKPQAASGVTLNARSLATAGVMFEGRVNEAGMMTRMVEMEDETGNIIKCCLVASPLIVEASQQQQQAGDGAQAKAQNVAHLTGILPWLHFQGAAMGDMLRIGSGKSSASGSPVWSIRLLKRAHLMAAKKLD